MIISSCVPYCSVVLFISLLFCFVFFFFFSSRRRHTRSDRDWSSDVCSSDLLQGDGRHGELPRRAGGIPGLDRAVEQGVALALVQPPPGRGLDAADERVGDRKSVV